MFKNLKAEMLKQNVSVQMIADVLHIKAETASKKINHQIGISISDCAKISKLFAENNMIDYLFKEVENGK